MTQDPTGQWVPYDEAEAVIDMKHPDHALQAARAIKERSAITRDAAKAIREQTKRTFEFMRQARRINPTGGTKT